jgi:PAS domain S-box-containing protein
MSDARPDELEDRVLALPPTARDGAATRDFLAAAGVRCLVCTTIGEVCREMERGAGAAVVTAEAVLGDREGSLAGLLRAQPPWSDFPLIVLTPAGAESPNALRALAAVGHMTLMNRPVQVSALVSTVRAALRDRRRQYEVRDLLAERLRAAEALRAEREQYRVTLASIGDAVIATDTNGRVTFLNRIAQELTGWGGEDAAGRPLESVFRIVDEHTRRPAENPARRALREGRVVGLANHTLLVARDGTERPIDDSGAPIRDEFGAVAGVVLVFRDIAERKAAEEARARLAAIVESSDDAIVSKTLDGTILSWNAGAERIFGYTAAEAVGKPITLIIPPERLAEEHEILGRLSRGERVEHFETVRVAKGGRRVHIALTISPVRDAEGRVVGASKVARDVTDRRRAEEALREKDERLQLLVGHATDYALVMTDSEGRVLEWAGGAERITGWREDEVRGRPAAVLFTPEDRAAGRPEEEMRTAAEAGRALDKRWHVRKDGTRFFGDGVMVPLRGPAGDLRGFGKVFQDVTDRKRAEEALREADRRKDEFIALLAHELRNPLAPIRNGLQVLRLSDDPGVRERSQEVMDRQLSHMVRLIDDLLDVSRISQNKMDLRRSRVLLAEAVGGAVETARPLIDAAGHELTVSLPPDPVYLDADPTRLTQVFANLLTNSAKYTERGGRIWLTAAPAGGEVVISVRDTGIGIPAASLPTIFDLFSQVDRSIERATGGLGIGLALVKGLVEMHGGSVAVSSGGPGRGTEFTVRLPVLATDPQPFHHAPGGRVGRVGSPGRRILVVDDNRDSAGTMAEMLTILGNEVVTAHDGVEAVEAAGAFRPEVVLMDVGMPRLNGYDATRRIREQAWGREMTVVALTGWGQEGDRLQSREAGCDGHLVKPVSLPDLEKLLAELTGRAGGPR